MMITIPKRLEGYLRYLVATGLYGEDLEDVTLRLVEQRIEELIIAGILTRKCFTDTEIGDWAGED